MSQMEVIYEVTPSLGRYKSFVIHLNQTRSTQVNRDKIPHRYSVKYHEPFRFLAKGEAETMTARELTDDESEALSKLIQVITIAPIPSHIIGLDGTRHRLTVSNGFNKVEYKWWTRLPDEWKMLSQICDALMNLVGKTTNNQQ